MGGILAILVGLLVIWLLISVVKVAFKLLAIGIAIAVAVVIYFAVRKMIGKKGG